MKELKDMSIEELREVKIEAERMADDMNKNLWKDVNKFWDNFVYEYEFRVTQFENDREIYFRDVKLDKAVRVEARLTKETIDEAEEAYRRFDGRGPSGGHTMSSIKENKYQSMIYLLMDGKIVAHSGSGTIWIETIWQQGDHSSKEHYFRRMKRLYKIEEWLTGNPGKDEVLTWEEINPWSL